MKASEFVEGLKKISVNSDYLIGQGFSKDYIEKAKSKYVVSQKKTNISSLFPIVELIQNYDCSKLEIGLITFKKVIYQVDNYIFFGKAMYHDLAIDQTSGTVVMLEEDAENLLFHVAKSDDSFLSALLEVAFFLHE